MGSRTQGAQGLHLALRERSVATEYLNSTKLPSRPTESSLRHTDMPSERTLPVR